MAYGGTHKPIDARAQDAFLIEIARHQEVPLPMLLSVIGVERATILDDYQQTTPVSKLLEQPLAPEFTHDHPEISDSIHNNTAMYDDKLEDALEADTVLQQLLTRESSDERARAVRSRRTIAALILSQPASDSSFDVA